MIDALEVVGKMKPCSFSYKDMPKESTLRFDSKTHFGFIAQELDEIFPKEVYNVVSTEDNGYLVVNANELVPLLVKCIHDLTDRVKELEKSVKEK